METNTPTADHDLLIEVNTNVKNMTQTMSAHISQNNQMMNDHEGRLRALESESQQLKGAQRSQKNMLFIVSTVFGMITAGLGIFIALTRG